MIAEIGQKPTLGIQAFQDSEVMIALENALDFFPLLVLVL
jgi:hypothetical protein